jgi:hypothetical protein
MDGDEHEEGFTVQGRECRAHPRFPVDEDSGLLLVSHGMPVKARIVDLSLTGCRVRAYDRFSGKAGRSIEVTFKTNGIDFRLNGILQWSDEHNYLGIRFVNITDRRRKDLAEVIEEMAAARAAALNELPAGQQTAEPAGERAEEPAAMQLVDADAVQAGELAAEKLPHARPAAERLTAPPAAPSELRRQPNPVAHRFATIILARDGSRLRGRILKLSLSDCRIRTEARIPVAIHSRVETEFHLQRFPFRLDGVIQTMHDRYTAGIHFLDLSEHKRQQVLELIDEMAQSRAVLPQDDALSAEEQHQAGGA